MQGQALPQHMLGVGRCGFGAQAPPVRHAWRPARGCARAPPRGPLRPALRRAPRRSAAPRRGADQRVAEGGEPALPRIRCAASSSQCASSSAGWPSAIARMMISRGGSRALRPSLACAGSGASARPTRGPRGGNEPPRRSRRARVPRHSRRGPAGRSSPKSVARRGVHVRLIVPAKRLVGDRARQRPPDGARARRAVRAYRSCWPSLSRRNSMSANGRAALRTSAIAAGPLARMRSSGILALRQKREAQAFAGADQRQRRLDRAKGGLPPGACRRRSTGSARPPSPTAARTGRAVSAVPSGATTLAKPASLIAIAST